MRPARSSGPFAEWAMASRSNLDEARGAPFRTVRGAVGRYRAHRYPRVIDRAGLRTLAVFRRRRDRQTRRSAHSRRSISPRRHVAAASGAGDHQRVQRHRLARHRVRYQRPTISPATRRCPQNARTGRRRRRHGALHSARAALASASVHFQPLPPDPTLLEPLR